MIRLESLAMDEQVRQKLIPGAKVCVTQQIAARDYSWSTEVRGAVVEFQQRTTREAVLLPLVEFDSITLASPALRNHSNDPNFIAAGWGDLWLAV